MYVYILPVQIALISCQDDDTDTVSYSIRTGDTAIFAINSSTGSIMLKRGKYALLNKRNQPRMRMAGYCSTRKASIKHTIFQEVALQ